MATRTIEVCDVCGIARRGGLTDYTLKILCDNNEDVQGMAFDAKGKLCDGCYRRVVRFVERGFSQTPSGKKRLEATA